MSIIQELKRRNVFRVGLAYVVIAWLLLQVADVVLNNIEAPDWVFQAILLVLGLGFPIVVLFAWAFEMTPEGIKKEKDVDRSQSITHSTGRKLDFVIIGMMALALAYFVWDKFLAGPADEIQSATRESISASAAPTVASTVKNVPADRSIAVLPFADMSPEGDQEYLSDGIAEELLNLLVQIPELQVAARTSSFSFKGKDVKIADVARELHVAHLLEGSVRKAGDRVRITAQLIKADDGYHLWSETFDRTLDDVFAIQDEISAAVVEALKIKLLGAAPQSVEVDPDAYALYLQGQYFLARRTRPNAESAVSAFEQALEIDPDYAPALAALSSVIAYQAGQGYRDLHEGTRLARQYAQRALEINPDLAQGHAALASIYAAYDWNWAGAEASYLRAQELAPGNAIILSEMGYLKRLSGSNEQSIELNRRAVRLDPLDLRSQHALGLALLYSGQLEEALSTYNYLLTMQPDFTIANLAKSRILLLMGKHEEAMAAALLETEPFWREYGVLINLYATGRKDEADELLPDFIEANQDDAAYQIAQIYHLRGDTDLVFEWLERAYIQRDGGLPEMMNDPLLKQLSGDPRWAEMLKKVGLYDAWLTHKT